MPMGDWIWGFFCPEGADTNSCVNYGPTEPGLAPLDMQFRSTPNLKLNHIWPQNNTHIGSSRLSLDDIVVATSRIGCVVPQ